MAIQTGQSNSKQDCYSTSLVALKHVKGGLASQTKALRKYCSSDFATFACHGPCPAEDERQKIAKRRPCHGNCGALVKDAFQDKKPQAEFQASHHT